MSGYQFIHEEAYGLKGAKSKMSAKQIVAEAVRKPEACPHVANPTAPTQLHGPPLEEWWTRIEQHVIDGATTQAKNGNRKQRGDRPSLTAGVASYPHDWDHPDFDQADYDEWKTDTLAFLRKRHGKQLGPVIEHTDEAHPHLHYYVAPKIVLRPNGGYTTEANHTGMQAASNSLKGGTRKEAYTEAMVKLQDDFHEEVSLRHGHARKGPGRERLTRKEWRERQEHNDRLAEQIRKVEKDIGRLEQHKERVIKIKDVLTHERKAMEVRESDLTKQVEELEKQRAELEDERKKIQLGDEVNRRRSEKSKDDLKELEEYREKYGPLDKNENNRFTM